MRDAQLHHATAMASKQSRSESGRLQVWSVLQERVYRSQIRDVEHLKVRLVEEWRLFSQNIVDAAVKQWRVRLRACVKAHGGHFEHQL